MVRRCRHRLETLLDPSSPFDNQVLNLVPIDDRFMDDEVDKEPLRRRVVGIARLAEGDAARPVHRGSIGANESVRNPCSK